MKTVDVVFKKMDIAEYYPQLDQVKVRIVFSDGREKAILKQEPITDPSGQVATWLKEIKSKLKAQHSTLDLDDHPLAGHTVIRIKQEEDILQEKMAKFLAMVRERIRSGKLAKISYFDMEKKLQGMSVNFD